MTISLLNANSLYIPLADGTVQTCVTSPPYYGLRDYGTARWEGGAPECNHVNDYKLAERNRQRKSMVAFGIKCDGSERTRVHDESIGNDRQYRDTCPKCGAARVDSQIGLEQTPEEYVANLVAVFREVRRVLRDDGTLWLNLGDSYAANGARSNNNGEGASTMGWPGQNKETLNKAAKMKLPPINHGLKPKDLIGIPWMVAFALRADGWYLRSEIIWHKPNPMPESARDRPTKAHEQIFLFGKGQWKTRVVSLSDLPGETVHFRYNLGFSASYSGSSQIAILLASSILDCAQLQHNLCLSPFDEEIRNQFSKGVGGIKIGSLPEPHRAAILSAGFLGSYATAKEFLGELNSLGIALSNGNNLLIGGGAIEIPLSPPLYADGNTTIAINNSGKISKFDFVHEKIITQSSASCNYYYDQEAVREPVSDISLKRSEYGWDCDRPSTKNACMGGDGIHTHKMGERFVNPAGRNRRSVWTVATAPYSGAHFATFPPKLIEPCILAGSKPGDIVLDPFVGSGTTCLVAKRMGRSAVGLDLSYTYLKENAWERVGMNSPTLF